MKYLLHPFIEALCWARDSLHAAWHGHRPDWEFAGVDEYGGPDWNCRRCR